MMSPAIRRVPPREEQEFSAADEGRYIATFIIDDDTDHVRYAIHLPLVDGDPTLTQLEDLAREKLRQRLREIADQI